MMIAKKMCVGILFGGQSPEHEVSFHSARCMVKNIRPEKYEVILIGINKRGEWFYLNRSQFSSLFENGDISVFEGGEKYVSSKWSLAKERGFSPRILCGECDVIFPLIHGPFGEDGTIQGLLKLANLPFVGSDVLGSAICMDKGITKRLLREAGIPTPRFRCLKAETMFDCRALIEEMGLPLFVKPARLGSSIGISKVHRSSELLSAIETALQYGEKILIEECIDGREIECAVLGNSDLSVSLPGEVIPTHEFYSYEAKYVDHCGAHFKLPAQLDSSTILKIQALAKRGFLSLECEGMARIDFFLRTDGKLFLSEINTIPGFTMISLYPKLWELSNISYSTLIDHLIQLALERHKRFRDLEKKVLAHPYISH